MCERLWRAAAAAGGGGGGGRFLIFPSVI